MELYKYLNKCKVNFRIKEYDGSHCIKSERAPYEDNEKVIISTSHAKWECSIFTMKSALPEDGIDILAKFKVTSGNVENASVGIEFMFDDWDKENYVLMPAAVYNGNRYESREFKYPPIFDEKDVSPDMPVLISDIPRLSNVQKYSKIQLKSGCMSTPAIGLFTKKQKTGCWMLTDQATSVGDSGISIEEDMDKACSVVSIYAPGVREDFIYKKFTSKHPSDDRGASFKEGDEIVLRCRLHVFECTNVQCLFDMFKEIRKELSGKTSLYHELPFSSAWDILEDKYNRQNWFEEKGYYGDLKGNWVTGWVHGMLETYPLLMQGTELSRKRVLRNLDFFFSNAVTPSGFFYDKCLNNEWQGTYKRYGIPHAEKWLLIRRSADVLYFSLKHFIALNKQDSGFKVPQHWIQAVRSCADAFVTLWKKYGQFGQMIHLETGDICAGGSTSAAIAPAALALMSAFIGSGEYLEVAKESANFYYNRDVKSGMTNGAPGDEAQCPDSESAFALLESFIVLYEVTGEAEWIEKAKCMANQCVSWVISYDYSFPPNTTFGSLHMHSTGAVCANVQNTHGAPGICTLSGDSLFKLYRATGDLSYLDLIRDIAHNIPQYVSRRDRPIRAFNGKYLGEGWISERVLIGELDVPIGEVIYGSNWPEISCMLTIIEIPGLYIQPDTGFVYPIDHIEAETLYNNEENMVVRVSNPTAFTAVVKFYVENSTSMLQPLGQVFLFDCSFVQVAPYGNELIRISKKKFEKML